QPPGRDVGPWQWLRVSAGQCEAVVECGDRSAPYLSRRGAREQQLETLRRWLCSAPPAAKAGERSHASDDRRHGGTSQAKRNPRSPRRDSFSLDLEELRVRDRYRIADA